jgi:cation diffusion facilitator CzcD-associated flavoprotein CzcO
MCQGYYRHEKGYTPEWPGMDRFPGPHRASADLARDLDYTGQARAGDRLGRDRRDAGAGDRRDTRARHHAAALADLFPHRAQRHRARRHAARARDRRDLDPRDRAPQDPARPGGVHARCFESPRGSRQELLDAVRAYLGPTTTSTTHFTPRYRPWRQRIAFVPDGDLFKAIRAGKASVVTDEIDRFTRRASGSGPGGSSRPTSSSPRPASTSRVMGDIAFTIDGRRSTSPTP